MTNLEFEIAGDWNLQGSNKKDLYISFVAKIDGWKKSVIFYKKVVRGLLVFFYNKFWKIDPEAAEIFL